MSKNAHILPASCSKGDCVESRPPKKLSYSEVSAVSTVPERLEVKGVVLASLFETGDISPSSAKAASSLSEDSTLFGLDVMIQCRVFLTATIDRPSFGLCRLLYCYRKDSLS
ncbi:hypothetical protein RRG08_041845 [Elysia crispata]|uniref:Uncharacterized protein n=1 Tax=Elysia crispata TaxID=231223 RepID=A0AAE0Y0P8_9GAST|nr:hypothetical protein RRG08_041845 [Elysia crispata]